MATDNNHFAFNQTTPSGARLRSGLTALETGRETLVRELATMTADLTGDGSSVTHFTHVVERYGFASNDDAKAAWDELNADMFKITGDSSVANVDTALRQMFTKLR